MHRYAKRVMVLEYAPRKAMVTGFAEIDGGGSAYGEVFRTLSQHGARLTMTNATSVDGMGKGICTFAGEVVPGTAAAALEGFLRGLQAVVDCKVVDSNDGLLTDPFGFPIVSSTGQRYILVDTSSLNSMFSRIYAIFGTGGQTLLFQEGETMGREEARKEKEVLRGNRLRKFERELLGIPAALGWGIIEIVEQAPDLSKMVVSVKDCFEASGVKAKDPNCWFFRGAIRGYFSEVLGRNLTCEETRCMAAGDEHCEFVLT